MTYYSQNGEDYVLSNMFGGKKDGFFVEVGCIDGRRFSNTLAFEEMGWKGLCVEAHAGYIGLIAGNRPNSIVSHCAAGDTDEDEVVFYANTRGTLSTLDRSKEAHFREQYGKYFDGFEMHSVPKRRLDTLFRENGIEKIDILSVDIEGTEADALRGIDFKRYTPSVVVVEADSPEEEAEVDGVLLPAGYTKSVRLLSNIFYLADKAMEKNVKGLKAEVALTHTCHPMDDCKDLTVTVTVDTTGPGLASSLKTLGRSVKAAAGKVASIIPHGRKVEGGATNRFRFYDTGFHGDRYLQYMVDEVAKRCGVFIETGANVGSTLAYMARTHPAIHCISCEPDQEAYAQAAANTAGMKNVTLHNETSQEFIKRLKREGLAASGQDCMFWLDAHGYGFTWPLKDELAFITSEFGSGYILIDDFKVPGLDCFLYDVYQGQICSFDFVQDSLARGIEYRLYYPAYTDRTSGHHPLCGWGLIEFGHPEPLELPEGLKDIVRRPEIVRL